MTESSRLRPIYLNNAGSTWPKPTRVLAEVQRALSAAPGELADELEESRVRVARFLSLSSPEGLLWTPGCTSALALAIENLPWAPGDRVLTSALEHHAMEGPIQRIVRGRQVVHEVSPYSPGLPFDLDWLRRQLQAGGVRLVAFSAASNVTGEILPAVEITALAHDYGALCLMDAAQTAGIAPMNASEIGVDLYCFAGHKGPLGPHGIGGLWASPRVQFACPSSVCTLEDAQGSVSNAPGSCDAGGVNIAGVLGLAAGVAWLEQRPAATEQPLAAARQLLAELRGRAGVIVFGGDGPRTAVVSFRMTSTSLMEARDRFKAFGIVIGVGAHCAPRAIETLGAEDGTLRVSFGVFNDATAIERILSVVDACS